MENNKHGEFISVELGGERFSAFIDGVPDKCQHVWDGEELSFNDDGKYFKKSEVPDYKTQYNEFIKFMDGNKIRGGCVSCSKCGKPFEPDLFSMP